MIRIIDLHTPSRRINLAALLLATTLKPRMADGDEARPLRRRQGRQVSSPSTAPIIDGVVHGHAHNLGAPVGHRGRLGKVLVCHGDGACAS